MVDMGGNETTELKIAWEVISAWAKQLSKDTLLQTYRWRKWFEQNKNASNITIYTGGFFSGLIAEYEYGGTV